MASMIGFRPRKGLNSFLFNLMKYRHYYIILIPAIIFFLVFCYYPMYGVIIAFKNFRAIDGILGSKWVGLDNFQNLFNNPGFFSILRNTVVISLLRLMIGFPAPIILALLFNEIKHRYFLRAVQSISYLPYFMSWVVLGGIFSQILSPTTGIVNQAITLLGGKAIYFLTDKRWFVSILITTGIWQSVGWGTIIYVAVISSIDPEMYESSVIEGAGRFQQVRYITLPCLMPTIALMLIFSCSGILNAGFDQIFNMYNASVYSVSDILDTYVYRIGIQNMSYSLSTAVGLFKNIVGLAILLLVNFIVKGINEGNGIW